MSIATATRPTARLSADSEAPVINHYYRKEDMTRAIVTGESILTMCGFVGSIHGRGNGSVAQRTKGVYIVCKDCKRAYEGLSAV